MFGIVPLLVLRTCSVITVGRAIDCTAGKLACSIATVYVASGSSASWRVPPPQPATIVAQALSRTTVDA